MTTPSNRAPDTTSVVLDYSDNGRKVEQTRSWSGLAAVVTGDIVIALAAIFALYEVASSPTSTTAITSILTSAFTAIGTLTTAYFGIKAASNTAQAAQSVAHHGGGGQPGGVDTTGGTGPSGGGGTGPSSGGGTTGGGSHPPGGSHPAGSSG